MGNQASNKGHDPTYEADEAPAPEITFTEEELRSKLTTEEYHVTQEKGMDQALVVGCAVAFKCVTLVLSMVL